MADNNIQLPSLPAAAVPDDPDLYHVRQGGTDKRITYSNFKSGILPSDIGAVPDFREIYTQAPLTGGDDLTGDVTLGVDQATTSNTGVVQLANISETILGTNTTKAVTPDGLNSLTADVTRKGLVERATDGEAVAGVDGTRYITPKQLLASKNTIESNVPGLVPAATTTSQGKVELATSSETITGSDSSRVVTPAGLKSLTGDTTRNGLVRRATNSEVLSGGDATKYVTPSTLQSKIDAIPYADTTTDGLIQLATQSQAQQLTLGTVAMSPLTMNNSFPGTKATNGYMRLPNGWTMQWGYTSGRSSEGTLLVTFPTVFSNACLTAQVCGVGNGTGDDAYLQIQSFNTSSLTIRWQADSGGFSNVEGYWFVIGH